MKIIRQDIFRTAQYAMSMRLALRVCRRFFSRICLSRQLQRLEQKKNTFFVILMPASIHVAIKSIELIEDSYNIVAIGNGLCDKEKQWLRVNKPNLQFVFIGEKLFHHQVLNAIFKNWEKNFGILDYDCFVFDKNYADEMIQLKEDQALASPFFLVNEGLNITIPETFFLFFNRKAIDRVMRSYKIDCRIYNWSMLNNKVKATIAEMGISESDMPERQKEYFDTLKLIFLLCLAEKYHFKFVKKYTDTHGDLNHVYHVGSISKPHVITTEYSFRGSFFWVKLLEALHDDVLRQISVTRFGSLSSVQMQAKYSEYYDRIDEDFFRLITELTKNA